LVVWGRKEEMSCKEFEKLIPDFISRKLDYPTLKQFYEHMERCEACKEELTVQFLVTEGIQHLEDGSTFDLQAELMRRLEETRQQIKLHGTFLNLGIVMEIAALCILAGIVIWMLL